LFVGAEDLAEEEQNPGEAVGEGLCRGVIFALYVLIWHRSDGVRKAQKDTMGRRIATDALAE
jgi:hypothetical protein